MADAEKPKLVGTVADVQKALQISRSAAYEQIGLGEIPSVKVGRSIRIPWQQFLRKFGLDEAA